MAARKAAKRAEFRLDNRRAWPFLGGTAGRGLTPAKPLSAWHLCNTQQKSSMTWSMFTDSAFSRVAIASSPARCDMKKILAAAAITLTFAPSSVLAQERVGDAALGALSGAVVLGPVGAVAGAVVGYTAGPSIAHSWGLRRSELVTMHDLEERPGT
jgi:hypothetical protein